MTVKIRFNLLCLTKAQVSCFNGRTGFSDVYKQVDNFL